MGVAEDFGLGSLDLFRPLWLERPAIERGCSKQPRLRRFLASTDTAAP